jgi:hypothetical protein
VTASIAWEAVEKWNVRRFGRYSTPSRASSPYGLAGSASVTPGSSRTSVTVTVTSAGTVSCPFTSVGGAPSTTSPDEILNPV